MQNELAKRPVVNIPTPILSVINGTLTVLVKKSLDELSIDLNKCIELGVEDDKLSREANAVVEYAIEAEKAVKEIRLSFTRPIDEGKKNLMAEVDRLLFPVVSAKEKLDGLLMDRTRKIQAEAAKIKREHEETVEAARIAAEKREETNRKISLAKKGTGEVAHVKPEFITQPVDLSALRDTVKTSSIVDKTAIEKAVDEGIREIAGVKIYPEWTFEIIDHQKVPKEYRKLRR